MTAAAWLDDVKRQVGIDQAARALGLTPARMSSWGPCPLCQATERSKGDRRGPVGIGKEKGRWICWACKGGGDVLDMLAAVRLNRTSTGMDADGWSSLREACVSMGWLGDAPPDRGPSTRSAQRVRSARDLVSGKRAARSESKDQQQDDEGGGGGRFRWSPTLAEEAEERLWSPDGVHVLAYLRQGRGFSDATIRAWRLGAFPILDGDGSTQPGQLDMEAVREWWLTIPLIDARDEVVNVRFRSLPGPCRYCHAQGCGRCKNGQTPKAYRVCPGRLLTLYGVHRLSSDLSTPPILVEGELDVVAAYEYGWQAGVVSGTAGAGAWKEDWLDALEPYEGFVVAYDDDDAGRKGAEGVVEKLGRYRCALAVLPRKDIGDCLQDKVPLAAIERAFATAKPATGVALLSPSAYGDALEKLISQPGDLVGRPTGSARLNAVLGGIRPGLITVTGETGCGKSTILTWLLDDQARLGVPSLLTSFEQAPIGTVQKLLRIEMGGDFGAQGVTADDRRAGLARIGERPLWIVDHRGSMGFEQLLESIRYAVRRLGVRNVLIDHLGFVIDMDAEDERREIERVIRPLSMFAEFEGVSCFLVCHPSNSYVNQRRRVMPQDLKGAAAIRQDSHEIWVIEAAKPTAKRPHPAAWIHLDKVRSDYGSSGSSVLLAFDPLATSYADSWEATPSGRKGVRLVQVPPERDSDHAPRGKRKRAKKGEAQEATDPPPDPDADPTTAGDV